MCSELGSGESVKLNAGTCRSLGVCIDWCCITTSHLTAPNTANVQRAIGLAQPWQQPLPSFCVFLVL